MAKRSREVVSKVQSSKKTKVSRKRECDQVQSWTKRRRTAALSLTEFFPIEILFWILSFVQPTDFPSILASCKLLNECLKNITFDKLNLIPMNMQKFRAGLQLKSRNLKITGPEWFPSLSNSEHLEKLTMVEHENTTCAQWSSNFISTLNLPKLRVFKIKERTIIVPFLRALSQLKTLEKIDLHISFYDLVDRNTSAGILEAWTTLVKNNASTLKVVKIENISGPMLRVLFQNCANLESLKLSVFAELKHSDVWQLIKDSKLKTLECGTKQKCSKYILRNLPSTLTNLKINWFLGDYDIDMPLGYVKHPTLSNIQLQLYTTDSSLASVLVREAQDLAEMVPHVKEYLPGLSQLRRLWFNSENEMIYSTTYPGDWLTK